MANNKVNTDKLLNFLGKKGKTANDVANKFLVTPATARGYLSDLTSAGKASTNGTKKTGFRGRPATVYANATF